MAIRNETKMKIYFKIFPAHILRFHKQLFSKMINQIHSLTTHDRKHKELHRWYRKFFCGSDNKTKMPWKYFFINDNGKTNETERRFKLASKLKGFVTQTEIELRLEISTSEIFCQFFDLNLNLFSFSFLTKKKYLRKGHSSRTQALLLSIFQFSD